MGNKNSSPSRGGRPSTSATGLYATQAAGSPQSPRKTRDGPGAGQENRDVRRHNSITLYDQVEGRAGPVGEFRLPRT